MILKVFKTIGLSLLCLIFFLVLTFPFKRMAPLARKNIENFLYSSFGISANCSLDDFDLNFPIGVRFSKLICSDDVANQRVLELGETSLILLPKYQSLQTEIGKGGLNLKANMSFNSPPTRIDAEFLDIPLERLLPILMRTANRAFPAAPKYFKAEGRLQGKINIPFRNLQKEKGQIDLQFSSLKIPQQSQLDLIGIKDLSFSKSSLKVNLNNGKLSFSDVNFLSQQLSGKVEGNLELTDDIRKSVGNITLKWKIEKSDAVLSSLFGPMMANNCPSPDSDGFCTRRILRVSDLGI